MKKLKLRRDDTCVTCGVALPAGTPAIWDASARVVICLECHDRGSVSEAGPGGADDAAPSAPVETHAPAPPPPPTAPAPDSLPADSPGAPEPAPPAPPPSGVAGASARAEYERRRRAREEHIDRKFGRFAGIVKFLVDEPQSTQAWLRGSEGERKLAEGLAERVGDRAVLLHDRRIPRSRANIDHLAVAASGVWVIDAKRYKGLVERRDVGGWFKIDDRLYVGGRDRSKLVAGVQRQVEVVRNALGLEPGDDNIPVMGALCFVDAEFRWFAKPFRIDGVWVIWGRKLSEMIAAEGPLANDQVLAVAGRLADALPPASGV